MNGNRLLLLLFVLVLGVVAFGVITRDDSGNSGSGRQGDGAARRPSGPLTPTNGEWAVGGPMRYAAGSYVAVVQSGSRYQAVRVRVAPEVHGSVLVRQLPGRPFSRRFVADTSLKQGQKLSERALAKLPKLSSKVKITPLGSAASCTAAIRKLSRGGTQIDLISGDIGPIGHPMFCAQLADRG